MVKKTKGKHRLDKFYHLAKEQGYRSRAAFKLVQLNRQFHFLDKCRSLLDLCAAPGGWMQVAAKTMPVNSLIIGIDLVPIKPIPRTKAIVGDITTAKARAAIKKEAGGSKMDVVLCDGAPNVGGAWASEAYTQSALVLEALRLATDTLAPGGTFVTKVFRSQDYNALQYAMKQLFDRVEATKPAASRNTSAEIFVVCQAYKAPAKIDARLLDPKHLFQEVETPAKSMGPDALLKQKIKQKRFREGYEEGLSTTHKELSAAAFIASDKPVELLGQYTRFVLNGAETGVEAMVEQSIREHAATTPDVLALLGDLQVLGRSEFKQLLKWRLQIRKAMAPGAAKEAPEPEAGESKEALDEEEKLLAEMADVKAGLQQRVRREKKRRLESKKKARLRAAQLAQSEGIVEAGQENLFSLEAVRGPMAVGALADTSVPAENAAEDSESDAGSSLEDDEDLDLDEEQRRFEAEREDALEEAYQSYLERQGQRRAAQRVKRARLGKSGDLPEADVETDGDDEAAPVPLIQQEEEEVRGAGLLRPLGMGAGRPKTPSSIAAQWFSQDMFAGEQSDSDDEAEAELGGLAHESNGRVAVQTSVATPAAVITVNQDAEELNEQSEEESDGAPQAVPLIGASLAEASGFEEVRMEVSSSGSDSESELEEPDEHTAAELRAMAKIMMHGRARSDILDAAYHRYAFHDDGLPKWFAEDEKRHMRPPAIVTKADIEEEKERMRSIDARPIKKVAEAKARKRKRLQTKLEQARSKAEGIVGQEDLSAGAKSREVARLYAKARTSAAGKKGGKQASRSAKRKSSGPPLDRRLLADKRQVNSKQKKRIAKKAGGKTAAKAGKASGKKGGGKGKSGRR